MQHAYLWMYVVCIAFWEHYCVQGILQAKTGAIKHRIYFDSIKTSLERAEKQLRNEQIRATVAYCVEKKTLKYVLWSEVWRLRKCWKADVSILTVVVLSVKCVMDKQYWLKHYVCLWTHGMWSTIDKKNYRRIYFLCTIAALTSEKRRSC